MLNLDFDWGEVTTLIYILRENGISYLLAADAPPSPDKLVVEPVELIQRLASCNYPLVEYATISLFLLHPEFAFLVSKAMERSSPEVAENIVVLTLATLYLQQWWFFRLTVVFGRCPSFPEEPFTEFWQKRHLPPPSSGYGRDGFLALQEYQQERYGIALNFLDDWQNQIKHLLNQEEAYQRPLSRNLIETLREHIS